MGPRGASRALKPLVAVLLASAALATAVVTGRQLGASGALRIRAIRFEGLSRASADELLALSPVKVGDSFLLADLDAMERALARHPWIRRVEIRRTLPPALVVRAEERTPAALVDLAGLYLVDEAGTVFKRAVAGDPLDLPLVTGISRAEYERRPDATEEILARAMALAQAWRKGGRRPRPALSEIHVDQEGFTVYAGEEGTEVRLGTGDLASKLARLDRLLSALRAERRTAEVIHLDNRTHPSWATIRLAVAAAGSPRSEGAAAAPVPGRAGGVAGRGPASLHH